MNTSARVLVVAVVVAAAARPPADAVEERLPWPTAPRAVLDEGLCEPPGAFPVAADCRRAALIVRGDAYRGLSYGMVLGKTRKKTFACDAAARAVQRAVSASHVANVIAPLERAGYAVDVYLATYGCEGLAPADGGAALREELVDMYGRDRVVSHEPLSRDGADQATPVNSAMRALRARWPAGGYRSVLVWRFDLVALSPVGSELAPARDDALIDDGRCDGNDTVSSAPMRPMSCWCAPFAKCTTSNGWDGYVAAADAAYYRYEDDWAFSFPGRLARCAVPVFEGTCLALRTHIISHECNFQLSRTYRVHTVKPRRRSWEVYREDYLENRGARICAVLRDTFGGPPCPADERAGRKVACLRFAIGAGMRSPTDVRDAHDGSFWAHGGRVHCADIGLTEADFADLPAWLAAYEAAESAPGRAPAAPR